MESDTSGLRPHLLEAVNNNLQRDASYEVVLGGGGIKGFGLIGMLQALEERQVPVDYITGISIGSIVATLYVNGFSPEQVKDIIFEELHTVLPDQVADGKLSWKGSYRAVTSEILGPYVKLWNLEKHLRNLVSKYDCKPHKNLRILASNLFNGRPVVFEGTDYNLVGALAASCAFPIVMKPIVLEKQSCELTRRFKRLQLQHSLLIDGGIHHPNPGHFCKGPAIIGKLGFARKMPAEKLTPAEYMCHLLEVMASRVLEITYPDPAEHIVVPVGMPDVAILSFALPKSKCEEMVTYGYEQTQEYLTAAQPDAKTVCGGIAQAIA
jgi:Patatin-like phospholipase